MPCSIDAANVSIPMVDVSIMSDDVTKRQSYNCSLTGKSVFLRLLSLLCKNFKEVRCC